MFTFTVPAGHKPGAVAKAHNKYGSAMEAVLCYTAPADDTNPPQTYLASCCGSALAILPVDAAAADQMPDKPLLLPAKACDGNAKGASVTVNGEVRRTSGGKTTVEAIPPQEGLWPNLKAVFPDPAKMIAEYTPVVLDAPLLAKLASAISHDGRVLLLIPKANEKTGAVTDPVVALGSTGNSLPGIGLICPLSAGVPTVPNGLNSRRKWLAEQIARVPDKAIKLD